MLQLKTTFNRYKYQKPPLTAQEKREGGGGGEPFTICCTYSIQPFPIVAFEETEQMGKNPMNKD